MLIASRTMMETECRGIVMRSVNVLNVTANNFGESRHTVSSESFFYNQSFRLVKHTCVDDNGRCVLAEEMGQKDRKTDHPLKWKCTAECTLPTLNEVQCILAVKALFEEPLHKLREVLNHTDECRHYGHYTRVLRTNTVKPHYELAGHPLPLHHGECNGSLRIL